MTAALLALSAWLWGIASPLPVAGDAGDRRPEATVLPVVVHVACEEGRPVVQREFVRRHLAAANRIFSGYGIQFALRAVREGPTPTRLETRGDRDQLAQAVEPGVINWFVVASLRDVDEPERMRRGVHWHHRGEPPAHYVVVAAYAQPGVLAHELGHFLGNRPHSTVVGNLMSYDWRTDLPVLDRTQQRRLQRAVRGYLRSGELRSHPPSTGTALTAITSPWSDW